MKTKCINENPRTLAIIFETGDEAMAGLRQVAIEHGITAATFSAIGAFEHVTLGYFSFQKNDYKHIPVIEQVEVLSLLGDVALEDGSPQIHAHVVVGKSDGTAHGGHLISGVVRPTLEVILTESPAHLVRKHDPVTGLALIEL
ncbi:MAG TPA: PPC domain-containing DNA-binding protein [Verrucomicrobiae bacterium]|jgi:hypothetical protein|nr:PPC domain-containing DNA-binding protein [Verrucomicrobiae bacterium]